MPIANEIRDRLNRYVSGQISLDVFHEWFCGASYDVEKSGDPEAAHLCHAVHGALADLSESIVPSEKELKAILADLVPTTEAKNTIGAVAMQVAMTRNSVLVFAPSRGWSINAPTLLPTSTSTTHATLNFADVA